MNIFMQAIGFSGAALLLLAYLKNATSKWTSGSLLYHWTNLGGAILICINTYHFSVYGPLILNFLWAIIAFRGLWGLYFSPATIIKKV